MLSVTYIKCFQAVLFNITLQTAALPVQVDARNVDPYQLAHELQKQEIDQWQVVLAQAIVESGWDIDSRVFKETGNFCGMRVPGQRPSMRNGIYKGYSSYSHWRDCVTDIKFWQKQNWKGGNREKYLDALHKWAEDPNYRALLYSVLRRIDRDPQYKLTYNNQKRFTFIAQVKS